MVHILFTAASRSYSSVAMSRLLLAVGSLIAEHGLYSVGSVVVAWGLSYPRDRTCVPCIGRQILNHWTTRKVPKPLHFNTKIPLFSKRHTLFTQLRKPISDLHVQHALSHLRASTRASMWQVLTHARYHAKCSMWTTCIIPRKKLQCLFLSPRQGNWDLKS